MAPFDRAGGLPVLLLHGWPVTEHHWRYLESALRATGMQPLSITVRGLGDGVVTGDFAKETLADEVADVVAELNLGPVAVVGHDWGGTVAYVLAAKHRQQVIALVEEEEIPPGVDAPIPEEGQSHYPDWHAPLLRADGVARRLLAGRLDDFHREFLDASGGPAGLDPTAVAAYLQAYPAERQIDADIALYASRPADLATMERLRRTPLTIPVLTVGGRYAMGTAVNEAFRQLATNVTHVQSEKSGHYPLEQDPDTVLRPLVDFLTTSRPSS
ncbi:alpha/beta hydrolase [Kribbella albertanoniae]|uniref:alpha/beta fold hydrolase n=1 Tax=Kribbella albertanoniae TaxID=1266829 RepID=UPI0030846CBA